MGTYFNTDAIITQLLVCLITLKRRRTRQTLTDPTLQHGLKALF